MGSVNSISIEREASGDNLKWMIYSCDSTKIDLPPNARNTTGATCEGESAYPSETPEVSSSYCRGTRCSVFCCVL